MVMVCRWVTIWRARRNRKFYGWSEPYDFLDQSCARMLFVVYGYSYGYGRPVETLLYLGFGDLQSHEVTSPLAHTGSVRSRYLDHTADRQPRWADG
jgi:hypothetical protein